MRTTVKDCKHPEKETKEKLDFKMWYKNDWATRAAESELSIHIGF